MLTLFLYAYLKLVARLRVAVLLGVYSHAIIATKSAELRHVNILNIKKGIVQYLRSSIVTPPVLTNTS